MPFTFAGKMVHTRRRCEREGEGEERLIRPSGALLMVISSLYYQNFILEATRLRLVHSHFYMKHLACS